MNAPCAMGAMGAITVRQADLAGGGECARIERFVAEQGGSVFHRPAWLAAIARGTGQRAHGLLAECRGQIAGWLPLTEVHSSLFGRALVSSGFGVGGGVLAPGPQAGALLLAAAQELAQRLACASVELRGWAGPDCAGGWRLRNDTHCGFQTGLLADDARRLASVPGKRRAELRKALAMDFSITVGRGPADLAAHYAVYAQCVHNLGTPVFPAGLFAAVIAGLDADILTVRHRGVPVASMLSLYHEGSVMPYWGGGTRRARALRANDRMYFELMRHGAQRGCTRFDFGRSKAGSGPWLYKRTWGVAPEPLVYASWSVPGAQPRDADPSSPRQQARIALWKKLPLALANRIGPPIARGLG